MEDIWTNYIQGRMGLRNNNELQNLIKGEDIVKYIKEKRIQWWGCLNRIVDTKLVQKITNWNQRIAKE
jgi:hypothetical protein